MRIFLTGATGVMGSATLDALIKSMPEAEIAILARDSKKNRKKLSTYLKNKKIIPVWGDLRNFEDVRRGVEGSDIVLHVGGMVPPAAEYHPETTLKVNVGGMQNVVDAAVALPESKQPAVVYIGSVSQYGPREAPLHWCRTGDPMLPADNDMYALSKIESERVLAESGLKRWVSLRQTAILYPALLFNGTDPITFHVPLAGALEWTTVEESATLLANLCLKFFDKTLPSDLWRRFYNIGSGEAFRLTNYQFEQRLLKAISCPPPEKIFDTNWFATRNFHGAWFSDSDRLESILPFRSGITPDEYFRFMASKVPAYFKLAGIVPAPLIKWGMKQIALKKGLGTLGWFRDGNEEKIRSYFKNREAYAQIPGWDKFPVAPPSNEEKPLSHGYDESKPLSALTLDDMRKAAGFRGGKCLSDDTATDQQTSPSMMVTTQSVNEDFLHTPLDWECAFGHRFRATPTTILLGGHWCPECLSSGHYSREASRNPFMAQAWLSTHDMEEME